jgi:hypothetical protein
MLLWHLLRKNIAVGQLVGYILATLLGLTIVLMSIQFFTDIRPVFSEKQGVFARDYLVISKKVSVFKTLKITNTSFSEDEMKEIADQRFIKRMAGFTTATFRVYASMAIGGKVANLGTSLFFESVPNEFLDIKPDDWKWSEGSNFIPIILPRSYLTLYNFGFAPSQGLPQLSSSMFSKLDLTIELTGNSKDALFHSRIVGFTDRINSILVPQSFMDWANVQFGTSSAPPSRLILEPYNLTDPHMGDFFASHDYEVANDKAAAGEASSFLRTLIFVVLTVGVIITLLALGLMLLSINLLIQKNHEKIENLALAGYPSPVIARPYQGLVIVINGIIFVLSFLMVSYLRDYYIVMFSSSLHIDDSSWEWNNLLWGGGIILGLTIVNNVWIYLKIREIRR